jgi:hypothetical protein
VATAILVPGVAQVKMQGTTGPNDWACIMHWFASGGSGNWTPTQLNAMCNALMTGMKTSFAPVWYTGVEFVDVVAVDIGTITPYSGISNQPSFAGTAVNPSDLSSCIMFNFQTAYRYRGGHGRIYLPGAGAQGSVDGDVWTAATYQTWLNEFISVLNSVTQAAITNGASGVSQVIPLYNYTYTDNPAKHKYTKQKTSVKAIANVIAVTGNNHIRTQRRRLGKP